MIINKKITVEKAPKEDIQSKDEIKTIVEEKINEEPINLKDNTDIEKAEASKLKEEGNELFKKQEYAQSIEKYEKAIKLNEKDVLLWMNKASALIQLQKFKEAIEIIVVSIKIAQQLSSDDNIFHKCYSRMGNAYYKMGDYTKAIKSFEMATKYKNDPETLEKIESARIELLKKEKNQDEKEMKNNIQDNEESKRG